MVGGAVVTSLSLVVSAVATGFWTLAVGSLLLGFGATCLVHAGEIVAVANGERPVEATLARLNLGAVAGDLLGPLTIAAGRAAGLSWRVIFAGAALWTMAYALHLATLRFPPARPVSEPDQSDGGSAPFRTGGAVVIGVIALLTTPLDETFLGMVLVFAEVGRGVSPSVAGALGAAFVAGGILTFTVLPRRLAAVAPAVVVAVAGVAMATSAIAVLVVPTAGLVLVGVVHSCALNASWLALQATALRLNPGREGKTSALISTIELGGFVLPVLIGVIADRAGLAAALVAFASLAVASSVVALLGAGALGRRATAGAEPAPAMGSG